MSGYPLDSFETFKVFEWISLIIPDRQMETSAVWMHQHPDIFVVSRDRASAYASAASEVAPQALQVVDRFHLVKNLHGSYPSPSGTMSGRNPRSQQAERRRSC